MMMMSAPITSAAIEPVATIVTKSRTVITAKRWTDEDAETNWRNKHDRARRWRGVIVNRRRCPVRLNHIGAGVRA